MTAEYCTEECVSASMPLSELFPCRARAQEDKDPPRAAELFYEAGLARSAGHRIPNHVWNRHDDCFGALNFSVPYTDEA